MRERETIRSLVSTIELYVARYKSARNTKVCEEGRDH